jgi:hypothetical protein
MRKFALMSSLLLFALALPPLARAQDADKPVEDAKTAEDAPNYYHLVFVVQELDAAGKPVNSRTYTTNVSTDPKHSGSIRTGSRIPIATGAFASGGEKGQVETQFQYIDVGVNFDIRRIEDVRHELGIDLAAEISSVAEASDARLHQPVIRQNRWQTQVLIPISKATVLFSSDSLDSKGSLQVTVTATPIQ